MIGRGRGRGSVWGWWLLGLAGLALEFGLPDVAGPGVFGEDCHEDDGGLVVGAPGGEALAVEGAFELGVEAFGVLAHAVEAVVWGADAQVFGAVEPGKASGRR